jgi:hypothetical protein
MTVVREQGDGVIFLKQYTNDQKPTLVLCPSATPATAKSLWLPKPV